MKNNLFRLLLIQFVVVVLFSSCGEEEGNPTPVLGEITPAQGASNQLLTLTGSDLRDIRTIVFETGNVRADFNPNFNTDGAILFRVPVEAVPGSQNIILTNKNGTQLNVPFNVLGFANITDVSNYNFSQGSQIMLTGKNLGDVSQVVFTGTSTEVQIIAKTATTLTLEFPATTMTETALTITNTAGESTTTQLFVSLDNAAKVFFTDDFGPGYSASSWFVAGRSEEEAKSGVASFSIEFCKGCWSFNGYANWGTAATNDEYKYLSFWVKGSTTTQNLYIMSDKMEGGWDAWWAYNRIVVPANEWTYFKIPVSSLKLWAGGDWNQLGWRLNGNDDTEPGNKKFYIDDMIFIK